MSDLIVSTLTQGLIYALLSYGVYITYSVLDFPDLTVDSSFPLGAAVTAILLLGGVDPWLTQLCAAGAGAPGRAVHGPDPRASGGSGPAGRHHHHDRAVLGEPAHCRFQCDCGAGGGYHFYLRAGDGAAGRPDLVGPEAHCGPGTGGGGEALAGPLLPHQVRAAAPSGGGQWDPGDHLAQNKGNMKVLGVVIANALVALCGGVLCQEQRSYSAVMGIGQVVFGLATVIIGISLIRFSPGPRSPRACGRSGACGSWHPPGPQRVLGAPI